MKSSKKRQVTAAFFAAAALGGVAHAAPVLNMNDSEVVLDPTKSFMLRTGAA